MGTGVTVGRGGSVCTATWMGLCLPASVQVHASKDGCCHQQQAFGDTGRGALLEDWGAELEYGDTTSCSLSLNLKLLLKHHLFIKAI